MRIQALQSKPWFQHGFSNPLSLQLTWCTYWNPSEQPEFEVTPGGCVEGTVAVKDWLPHKYSMQSMQAKQAQIQDFFQSLIQGLVVK